MRRSFLGEQEENIPDKGNRLCETQPACGPPRSRRTFHISLQSSSPSECIIARHAEKAPEEGQKAGQLGDFVPSPPAHSSAPWASSDCAGHGLGERLGWASASQPLCPSRWWSCPTSHLSWSQSTAAGACIVCTGQRPHNPGLAPPVQDGFSWVISSNESL